jgi:hypothetical protein
MPAVLLKPALLAALLLWQLPAAPDPAPPLEHLRYQRTISLPAARAAQACATLDAQVFAHAAPSLKDLRLFNGAAELPYATTLSQPLQQESDDARILNLGLRNGRIAFDLEMPRRPYTDVLLNLKGRDFLATASVFGEAAPNGPPKNAPTPTELGSFTLFDLSSQHLSRNTTLPLTESSFPYLHIELAVTSAPGAPSLPLSPAILQMVKGATVPPSREAQTLYTTAAQSSTFTQRNRQTLAAFTLPVRVPIERISFALPPGFKGNFSRTVEIAARAQPTRPIQSKDPAQSRSLGSDPQSEAAPDPQPETVTATILRVHATEAGRSVDREQLSIPVSIGSNMQLPATLQIAVDNGNDPPLPLAAVRLEMRQRRICFDPAAVNQALTLAYGDPAYVDPGHADPNQADLALEAPVYDYAKLFRPAAAPQPARLESEHLNPTFHPRPDGRPFTERHPELLWVVLLGVISVLATVALRSVRNLMR